MHFLDEASFRWDRLEMRELRALLARMYPGQQAVEDVLDEVPYPTFKVNWTPTVYAAWKDILKRLHGAQLLRDLIRVVLADEDQARHHQALRDLTGPRPLLPTGRLEDSTELTWKAVSETDAQGLERLKLAGRPDLMTPAFMAEGVRVKDAVARLEAEFGSGSRLCGTGFLIGENLLLTCFHVLHAGMGAEAARKVEVKFGYELGLDDIALPWQIFAGDCSSIEGDRKYDWSVIRLQPVPGMDRPRLALGSTKPLDVNDRAYVIQHPQGKEMRVALHGNQVRHVDDEVLQYLADTDQGSSGAPVFNDRWQVVGLHRRYVELKGDGDLYRNEAVNIRRVMAALRAKGIPFTALADPTADEGDAAP